jgi:hypothetical protein
MSRPAYVWEAGKPATVTEDVSGFSQISHMNPGTIPQTNNEQLTPSVSESI